MQKKENRVRLNGRKVMKPKVVWNNRIKNPIPPQDWSTYRGTNTNVCTQKCSFQLLQVPFAVQSSVPWRNSGRVRSEARFYRAWEAIQCCCRGRLRAGTEWKHWNTSQGLQCNTSTLVLSLGKINLSTAEASGPISSSFSVNEHVYINPHFD